MRLSCATAVLASFCVLAGCLMVRAAPRRGGGGGGAGGGVGDDGAAAAAEARWIQNFVAPEPVEETKEDFDTNRLIQRVLDRLQQRLLTSELAGSNAWVASQGQTEDFQRYSPTDQEDPFIEAAEVPNRPAIKRKCIGRFQPYAMNC